MCWNFAILEIAKQHMRDFPRRFSDLASAAREKFQGSRTENLRLVEENSRIFLENRRFSGILKLGKMVDFWPFWRGMCLIQSRSGVSRSWIWLDPYGHFGHF